MPIYMYVYIYIYAQIDRQIDRYTYRYRYIDIQMYRYITKLARKLVGPEI